MYPTPSPKTGTPSEKTKHQQSYILKRRRDGISFPMIAEEMGMTQGYVYKLYKKALKEIIVEDVEEVRKMELLRLEQLEEEVLNVLRAFHPVINSGEVVRDVVEDESGAPLINPQTGNPVTVRLQDTGPKLAAVDRAIKLMERRARLLGLDAPTKVAPTTPDGDKPYVVTIQASPLDEQL